MHEDSRFERAGYLENSNNTINDEVQIYKDLNTYFLYCLFIVS